VFIARSTASTSSCDPKLDRSEPRLDDGVGDGPAVIEAHELDDRQIVHARVAPRCEILAVLLLG
jgi:hypothetical protein